MNQPLNPFRLTSCLDMVFTCFRDDPELTFAVTSRAYWLLHSAQLLTTRGEVATARLHTRLQAISPICPPAESAVDPVCAYINAIVYLAQDTSSHQDKGFVHRIRAARRPPPRCRIVADRMPWPCARLHSQRHGRGAGVGLRSPAEMRPHSEAAANLRGERGPHPFTSCWTKMLHALIADGQGRSAASSPDPGPWRRDHMPAVI